MNSIEKVLISSFPISVFLVPFRGWDVGVIIYHSSNIYVSCNLPETTRRDYQYLICGQTSLWRCL